MRAVLTLVGVICTATLFSELLAAGVLWYRGQLTADTVADVAAVLRGEDPAALPPVDEDSPAPTPTVSDVAEVRARTILDIESRENEVDVLRAMLDERSATISREQAELERAQKAFDERLDELERTWQDEATEQARAVLKAQQPPDAAAALLELPLDEAVILVRGLPEKSIARILQEFQRGNDEKHLQRGRDIFEAIARGEPRTSLAEEARDTEEEPPEEAGP